MDAREIRELLIELGRRLDARGLRGEVYLVGGAAIALGYDARRSTRDIDAVFEPKAVIYAIAGELAEERALDQGWLNDAVKGFLAGNDDEQRTVLDVAGLHCAVASPRLLLAMKVLAHRIGEDADDLRLLARELGLSDAKAILAVAQEVYGARLDLAARFFVEELFPDSTGLD